MTHWMVTTIVTISGKDTSRNIIISIDKIIFIVITSISVIFLCLLFYYTFREKRLRHYFKLTTSDIEMDTFQT